MLPISLLLLAFAISYVHAVPTSGHVLHEKRSHGPWESRTRLSSTAILPIRIGLVQQNLHHGGSWLAEVSNPSSERYGKFWTADEVKHAFAPAEEAADAVVAWLEDQSIDRTRISQSFNKGWLTFNATRHEAERLFHAEFYETIDSTTGRSMVSCEEYYLPGHIRQHIDYVKPGVMPSSYVKKADVLQRKRSLGSGHRWPGPQTAQWPPALGSWPSLRWSGPYQNTSLPVNLVNCSIALSSACLEAMYKIPPPSGPVSASNSLGIFEEGDTYAQQDLDLWFSSFSNIPNGTHPVPAYIDGAVAPLPLAKAGGESELDLTIAYALIYPQTVTLYQTNDPVYAIESMNGTYNGFLDTFLDAIDGSFCTYSAYGQTGNNATLDPTYPDPQPGGYKGSLQCGVYKPANVISISYLDSEARLPVNYQKRQCNEWMKLALQGHTILFASGDYGVASFPNKTYPNGTCLGDHNQIFQPGGPGTCPYVTTVGATQIPDNGTVYSPATAALRKLGNGGLFTSGGGFSNIFPTADYQKAAVAKYFATSDPGYPYYETVDAENVGANGGIYNRIGRAYPDISAAGSWWLDYTAGKQSRHGGTSMAAPIVASMINRIVKERIKIGKGPIGFLNPHIYANPWLLDDVTQGRNYGCGTAGFDTAQGWDPVTGLGEPSYPRMLEYFLHLP